MRLSRSFAFYVAPSFVVAISLGLGACSVGLNLDDFKRVTDGGTDSNEPYVTYKRDASSEAASFDAGTQDADMEVGGDAGEDAAEPLNADPGAPDCAATIPPTGTAPISIKYRSAVDALVVDGRANDWPMTLERYAMRNPFPPEVASPPICADYAAAWNTDALYIYARIAKPQHIIPEATKIWLNDTLEVFVGAPAPLASGYYRNTDNQLLVDHRGVGFLQRGTTATGPGVITGIIPSGAAHLFAAREFSWGFAVEVRINAAAIGLSQMVATIELPFSVAFDEGYLDAQQQRDKRYAFWRLPVTTTVCGSRVSCCGPLGPDNGPFCSTQYWDRATLTPP
jgi:hypothetical protein